MKHDLISIIVPVYNGEPFIGACIESVATQTHRNIELIIVDDGSDDGTATVIAGTAAKHPGMDIRILSGKREGVSMARNKGIDAAKGDFIAFLDADDTYLPDAMEYLLNLISKEEETDIAIAQFEELEDVDEQVMTAEEAVANTLYQSKGFHEGPWAKLFSRQIFASGARFTAGRRYEDMEVCPDFYMQARMIAFSGHKVYNYTDNPTSFINTWHAERLDALWATESITKKWGTRFPGGCRHRRFSAVFNIFNLACVNGDTAVTDKCWAEIRSLRKAIIGDRRSRRRNRFAAIASYSGKSLASFAIRMISRQSTVRRHSIK